MQARVVALDVQPGKVDELHRFFEGERVQEIRQAAGNRGFYLLADASANKVLLMSLWDSDADAQASRPIFQRQMGEAASLLAGPPSPQGYEVRIQP